MSILTLQRLTELYGLWVKRLIFKKQSAFMHSATSQSLSLLCCKLANTTCHSSLVTGLLLFNCWCNPSFSFTTSWTRILKVFISSWNETHGNRHPHEHIRYRLGCCCLGKSNVTAIAMAEPCSSSRFSLRVPEPLSGLRSTAYWEKSQVTEELPRTGAELGC